MNRFSAASLRWMMALLFVSAAIWSCNRNAVSLSYTNARDEVPQLGNLTFRFSAPLATDSMLNQWDSTEYVSFSPKIRGRFRWESRDQLVFSPAEPLPPASSFTASLNKVLLKRTDFTSIEEDDELTFKTADLKLENTHAFWTLPDGAAAAIPQIDLYFNYNVDPKALMDKLTAELDGNNVEVELITVSNESKVSVRLRNVKPEDKDLALQLSIAKGLVPDKGKNGTAKEEKIEAVLPSPFVLSINDVTAEHDGVQGSILIKTSQQLVAGQFASFIELSPKAAYSSQLTEDGLLITSEQFSVDNSYTLTFKKGLRGKVGGVLKENYSTSVAFGSLEPSLSFASSKAVYLGKNGAKNIEVRIANVPKIKVIVSKVYESNLLMAHRYGYYPKEQKGNEDEEDYYYYEEDGDAVLGDVVYESVIDTRSLPKYGSGRLFQFNLTDKLSDVKGIYHVKIRSTEDYWISDSRFVALSDVGLIAKQGVDKMLVFANSIQTAKAMSGVAVSVYGANNQLLGTATTNSDGVAEVPFARQEFSGFKPAMVIAKTGDDFNYLPFHNTAVNTSRFEVGGKRINSTGLDAFVYPERDIYRPGEKMNAAVVLRDRNWKSPGSIPIKMKVLMPNGKELTSLRKNLNAQGAAEVNVPLSASAITGTYVLEVYNGNDVLLASKNLKVETFMPDRIKVNANLDKESAMPGQSIQLNLQASNYFGPPAAGRKYECEIQVKQKHIAPAKYNKFDFDLSNERTIFDKVLREGLTNDQGIANTAFDVPAMYANLGVLEASFFSTVFDETGRPVNRVSRATIYTQPVLFGLGNTGWNYFPLRQNINFPVIAINSKEQVMNATAQIQVIKHEYRTVLSKSGSYFRYESQKESKVIASRTMQVSGEQSVFPFTPTTPGEYEIRIAAPGVSNYVSQRFYSYGTWGNADAAFEVNREGNVDISLDKNSYNNGETVKALFKTPFNGRMLVTVETDKVVSYQYVDVNNRNASLNLKIDDQYLPNAYISATLFKPHTVTDMPLTVAHGYANIKVEDKSKRMTVSIDAKKETRSRTHQKVTVKAAPNSMVTLAAVDNGVLAVSNFKTPDPFAHFFATRALSVNGYDLYPLLFPELRRTISSSGGDADLQLSQRQNPMPDKRVKLVSFWSGIRQTGSNGEATFEFDIPQFSGEVRLMAVACKDNQFGAAESNMKVADPLVVSTALPRFMSPGDTVLVPVTITNTTNKTASINARLLTTAGVQIAGSNTATTNIEGKREGRVLFKLFAPASIGTANIKVEINGLGEQFLDETDISIRPASTLQKLNGAQVIPANTAQVLRMNTLDFIPQSLNYTLTVSRNPLLELGGQLQYLVQYPFGCTEQTVSVAFPQLYFSDLSDMVHTQKGLQKSANENVAEAIRKIKMRQLYNGGVTLWDNESQESWWTTAYAAHFLVEAKKAGYEVDRSLLETMLNYLNNKLRNKELVAYFYNRNLQKKIAPKEVAYSLYVLSLAGRPAVAAMNYYKTNQKDLALDSRYLLSAAYTLAGDKASAKALLPGSFAGEEAVASTGGSFYSDIRDEAVALNALIDAEPTNTQVGVMARHVAAKLKGRSWYTTQECAFGFVALGKIARKSGATNATAVVTVGGKQVGMMSGAPLQLTKAQLNGTNIQITSKGNGNIYAWWQTQGISASGAYKEEDSYLKVRRSFYDRFGRPVSSNSFKQNDLIVVKLTLEKTYSGTIDNVVLTDILPAGFEIENSRIKELPGNEWIKDASNPLHTDIRDDRIHFFTNLNGRQTFYYTVRAVSPGTFTIGPASADAMYNGEYHSYHGAGTIKIVQ